MKKPKLKRKTWHQLQENKCPKCNEILQEGMFGGILGCSCGFIIDKDIKNRLVERDK